MRHLVLALMIALLPLRGWVGDAMAMQMAMQMASSVVATNVGAASAHKTGATGTFHHQNKAATAVLASQAMPDCHGQAASQPDSGAPENADHSGHSGTCQACQACHTLALSPSTLDAIASFASTQLRSTQAATFASATTALGQKPPIS